MACSVHGRARGGAEVRECGERAARRGALMCGLGTPPCIKPSQHVALTVMLPHIVHDRLRCGLSRRAMGSGVQVGGDGGAGRRQREAAAACRKAGEGGSARFRSVDGDMSGLLSRGQRQWAPQQALPTARQRSPGCCCCSAASALRPAAPPSRARRRPEALRARDAILAKPRPHRSQAAAQRRQAGATCQKRRSTRRPRPQKPAHSRAASALMSSANAYMLLRHAALLLVTWLSAAQ